MKKLTMTGGLAAIALTFATATTVTATTGFVTASEAQAQSSRVRVGGPVRTRPNCTTRLRCTIIRPHGARRCWRQRICTR